MKLKQEDRGLFKEFFLKQARYMKSKDLLLLENLKEFQIRFLPFIKDKHCENNIACKMFLITLEHEFLKCEERRLIKDYEPPSIRVKLNYRSIIEPETNNSSILIWVNESKIAISVPGGHMQQLDTAILKKTKENGDKRSKLFDP